ncbi:hypothetical protein LB504_011012 [Fusarium proliferatum]|nr:hypothetical protein LB504_011012 [Fusarium proliferatum]
MSIIYYLSATEQKTYGTRHHSFSLEPTIMNQQSISQSTDNENGNPGPIIVSEKFRNELKKVLQDINELSSLGRIKLSADINELRSKPTPI